MFLGKKKVSILLIVCFMITYCMAPLPAYAASKPVTRVLIVTGEVCVEVNENGSPSSQKQMIPVFGHEVVLAYMENGGGSYAEVKVKTDEKGHFRAQMVVSGAGKIIAKIKTENAACTVSSGILSKSYKYTTAPIKVKKNQ